MKLPRIENLQQNFDTWTSIEKNANFRIWIDHSEALEPRSVSWESAKSILCPLSSNFAPSS